jgi:Xaa-Pro dipeptidase
VVLAGQLAAIEATKPGIEHKIVAKASDEKLYEGLIKLGILKGDKEELMKNRLLSTFMPHSLSHYIGNFYCFFLRENKNI